MDVDRFPFGRGVVAEGLHAIDEPADTLGLVDDQLGQGLILGRRAGLQQLGGAADPGQRVLDLMGQHTAQADDRAQPGRIGPPLCAKAPASHMQGHQNGVVAQRRRGAVSLEGRMSEQGDLDRVFANPDTLVERAGDQGDQRRARRQCPGHPSTRQQPQSLAEQRLGGLVGRGECAVAIDQQRRLRTVVEGCSLQVSGPRATLWIGTTVHAAILSAGHDHRAVRPDSTSAGRSRLQSLARASRRTRASAGQGAAST